jgi:hypothetical protein
MSIESETLMAYADGELDAVAAKRVEKAIAADPALAAEVERHRALRARLKAHFDPVAAVPLPEALTAELRGSAKIVDLAAAREARAPARAVPRWWSGAVAAALVVGVVLGLSLRPGGESDFTAQGGRMVASGSVARALDNQLAVNQPAGAPVKMLVSFRDPQGTYCRAFQSAGQGGIACREEGAWRVREFRVVSHSQSADYRQAGSDASALLADAQAMMAGEALDAAQEQAAAAKSWRRD